MKTSLAIDVARLSLFYYGRETKQRFRVWQRPDQEGFFFGLEGTPGAVHISGLEVDRCDADQFKALMTARLENLEAEMEDARRALGLWAFRAPSLHVTNRIAELENRCEILLREAKRYRKYYRMTICEKCMAIEASFGFIVRRKIAKEVQVQYAAKMIGLEKAKEIIK